MTLLRLLCLAPAVIAAALAWALAAHGGANIAILSGLWAAAAVSGGYMTYVLMQLAAEDRNGRGVPKWSRDLLVLILPFYALAVAAVGFIAGWSLTTIAVQARRVILGVSPLTPALLRTVPPALALAAIAYIIRRHTRPTLVQRIWRLAAAAARGCRSAERKLLAMHRRACARRDLTTLEALAKAPNMPASVLRLLAADPDEGVRACAANNSDAPPDVLERMLRDPAAGVRRAIAHNDAASAEVLAVLASDGEDGEVREMAALRLEGIGG